MAKRELVFTLLAMMAVAGFAQAECTSAAPTGGNVIYLTVDPASLAGQITIQIYLVTGGGTQCTMTAEVAQQARGFSLTASPAETTLSGNSYSGNNYVQFPLTITATASAASAAPETVNIRLLDKDTGAVLATVPVLLSISGTGSPSAKPHTCTKENTTECTATELLALQMGQSVIEQNESDIYLLVGIIASFALIIFIFFVVIPRK